MIKERRSIFGTLDMTVGSPFVCLLMFSIPLLIGNFAQMMYTAIDAAVVGKYIGDTALGAIGTSNPVYNFFLVLFMGVGSGVTIMVSQYFGAKDYENLNNSIGNSITLIAIISVIITAVATPLTGAILRLVSTPPEMFDMAQTFLVILFLGSVGNGFYNVLSAILRGLGESVFPLAVLLATVGLNAVLVIWFIGGLHMGIEGAAYATVISQVLSSVVCLVKILLMRDVVRIRPSMLRLRRRIVKQIIHLGLPNAIAMGIMFGAVVIVQKLVNSMGVTVAAAITATIRLDGFAVLPGQTFSVAASTFTGQNIGAGKMDRVRQGSRTVSMMCLLFTIVMVASMLLFGRHLIRLFTDTDEIVDMCMTFILIMSPAYLALVTNQCRSGVMRGAGDTIGPMWISLFMNVALRVPMSFIIAYFTRSEAHPKGNPNSIFIALSASMLIGAVISTVYYRSGRWRNKSIVAHESADAVVL